MKTILMLAISADGKIAKHENHLADWTSAEDKKEFIKTTKEAGNIIMGRKTYDTIGRPLPNRLNLIMTRSVESRKKDEIPGTLEFTDQSPKDIIANLEKLGFETAIVGGGTAINTLFLKENLIDEIKLTIEPKLFGSGFGIFDKIDVDVDLELLEMKKLNDNTIYLHYKIIK